MALLLAGLAAVFLAILVAGVTLALPAGGRAGLTKALDTIDRMYAPGTATPADAPPRRPGGPLASLGNAVNPHGVRAWLQRWLDYAGNPASWPPERIMEMQGLGLLVVTTVFGTLAIVLDFSWSALAATMLLGALAGFWLPFGIVYDAGLRRQAELRRQLPDALDLLTLSVEAGLGFDAAVAQVAGSMPGALAREFARMLQEMQMGQRRADALRALGARTRVLELRTMATSLVQATELGIPIANVLREQAREMRVRRRQRAEEQARKVPVKVIFPLILCLFPALFVVIVGPGVLGILHTLLQIR
jgi:tight adherence protein C